MARLTRLTLETGGAERPKLHLRHVAEANAPLDTVGEDLRRGRQRLGEDLDHIAGILKIRKDHLEAIEESQFDALPGRTYALGFVRTYASYLGLDAGQCIERLKREISGVEAQRDAAPPVTPPEERKLPQGWLVFAGVLAIAVTYGGYYFVTSAGRVLVPATTPVPERLAAEATPPVQANANTAAAATAAPPAATADANAASAPAASDSLPEGQKYGVQNTNSRITLRIHREIRVDVTGPNNRVFIGRVLKPGDTYRVPNLSGLVLAAEDAGAVEMLLDGESVGFAGKDGAAAQEMTLTVQAMAERRKQAG